MSDKKNLDNTLTDDQKFEEWVKCSEDYIYFIKNYCYVQHPKRGKILMDAEIYEKQEELLHCVHNNRFTVTNKTRQCGASTVLGLYALWLAMFNEGKEICIISRKDGEAKNFKRRYIDFPYNNLPNFFKSKRKKGSRLAESTHERSFDTGSLIKCEAGPDAGRGGTYSFIILDEAGFIKNVEETWAAIFPTLNVGNGKAVVNSTSSAIGTWYANVWHEALERTMHASTTPSEKEDSDGISQFVPFVIEWFDVPYFASNPNFLKEQEKNLTPHTKFRREVLREFIVEGDPFIPEAFIKTISPVSPVRADFLLKEDIVDVSDALELPETGIDLSKNYIKGLWIWEEPVKRKSYIISVDVSEGRANDRSCVQVINVSDSTQAAEFLGRVDTFDLAFITFKLAKYYNEAYVVIEYNSMGVSTFNKMYKDLKYDNLFWRNADKPGWQTSPATRDLLLNSLYRSITSEDEMVRIRSSRLKVEIQNFVIANGKVQAAQGTTDDAVMAFAIGVHIQQEYSISHIGEITSDSVSAYDDDSDLFYSSNEDEMAKAIEESLGGEYEIDTTDYKNYRWMYD